MDTIPMIKSDVIPTKNPLSIVPIVSKLPSRRCVLKWRFDYGTRSSVRKRCSYVRAKLLLKEKDQPTPPSLILQI